MATQKKIRQQSPGMIHTNSDVLSFNPQTGGHKVTDAGHRLVPTRITDATTYTTDFSTKRSVRGGKILAVYNKDTAVHAITFGDTNVTALAVGITDSSGRVGIACPPGVYTYLANWTDGFAITDDNKLVVYIVDDPTYSTVEVTESGA